jgi:3-oxoadipate enol-lactonase
VSPDQSDPSADTDETASPLLTPDGPEVPRGEYYEVADRGLAFIRDAGPRDRPALILLHGWTASADLNWFTSYGPLAERYRVIAFDQRGHGRGLRSRKTFRLEDCADDAVAIADLLGVERATFVGYSMGGAVAQLVWHRHPHRVRSLVLSATSRSFNGTREENLSFIGLSGLAALARAVPAGVRERIVEQYLGKNPRLDGWAVEEVRRHDWTAIAQAGRAIGAFSSREWIGNVDVPTSVIITTADHVVPPRRQLRLAESVPRADIFRIDGDHDVCVTGADRFVPLLIEAIEAGLSKSHS